MKWLLKCGLTAAAIIGALWAVAASGINDIDQITISTDATNLRVAKRYISGRTPDVVLVGSSLTYRLSEGYFQTSNLTNLAFAGGASSTGVEIIKSLPTRPRIILVEANILTREPDDILVKKALDISTQPLRIVRWLGAKYNSWQIQSRAETASELLSNPPSAKPVTPLRPSQGLAGDGDILQAKSKLHQLIELTSELERSGSKVLWFELPYRPDMQSRNYAKFMSEVAHSAIPDPSNWLDLQVDLGELRWTDGEHLDDRSSALFARAIDRAIERIPR